MSERPDGSAVICNLDLPTLLRQHDRWLRSVVYARVGEWEGVEDVMQEVALAAVKRQGTLPEPSRLAPWLYRVAVRQSLLYRRKAGRRRKLTAGYVEQVPPREHDASSADPLDWLVARERAQKVRATLDRLPRRDQEILLLKYADNLSYRQIAEHIGATESAVEARLHRARARLRAALASSETKAEQDEVTR